MEKAKSYYLRAAHLLAGYAFPRAYVYRSRAWNNYGTLLQAQDSAAKYMDIIITRALPYSRMAGDSSAVSQHLQNIGLILANLQDLQSAAHYYQQAMYTLSNFEAAYENKLTVYVNAAKNAMNLDHIDLARMYLDSAEMQLHEVPHSTYAPYYYRTKGVYFRNVKDKDRALASFRQGITLAEDLLDDFAQRDLYFEMYRSEEHTSELMSLMRT